VLSYFVIPFISRRCTWVAVGMETVVPHPVRGAHPIADGFIYQCPDGRADASRAMRLLAHDLRSDEPRAKRARVLTLGDQPRRRNDPMLDADMLLSAANRYREGSTLFVRTHLLAPTMHPRVLFQGLASVDQRVIHEKWIVGVEATGADDQRALLPRTALARQSSRAATAGATSADDETCPRVEAEAWWQRCWHWLDLLLGRRAADRSFVGKSTR
jgi:hypothetical protein